MSVRISSLIVAVLGVGCVADQLEGGNGAVPATSDVQQAFTLCPEFMCGTNSPQIAQFGFWDLNLPPALGVAGQPNNVGLQLLGFSQNNVMYLPRVSRGRLSASRTIAATPPLVVTLSGQQLVGGMFVIRSNVGTLYALKVSEVGSVDSWATSLTTGSTVALETYKLDWAQFINGSPERYQNVCKNPPVEQKDGDDTLGMTGKLAFHTLLFEGDRIDAAKKLETGVDLTWFNLGCAGSALAKLALTGHTEAGQRSGAFTTTLGERQTMIKMLAADYCGDGTPFTVAGQPLNWRDDQGTMKLLSQPNQLIFEARWTEKGAACLNKPRVDVHPTKLSNTTFGPDVYDQVAAWCPTHMPPVCSDSSLENNGYHLITATPL